jgi:hypothetical protein
MSLTNFELEDIAKSLGLPIVGVFSKDQLPSKRIVGSYYINLQNSDEGSGTHWVFARIFPCGKAIYYDSFGIAMPIEVEEFLKPFKPIAYSNRQIQDIKSSNCGRYCILTDYFFSYQIKEKIREYKSVEERKRNCPVDYELYRFLDTWTDDTKKNEHLCIKRFNAL